MALPDDGKRYELIEGLVLNPAPVPRHQWIIGNLYYALRTYFVTHGGGRPTCRRSMSCFQQTVLEPMSS
jgi:hypothetical protein